MDSVDLNDKLKNVRALFSYSWLAKEDLTIQVPGYSIRAFISGLYS
jgi:hypothetical protein